MIILLNKLTFPSITVILNYMLSLLRYPGGKTRAAKHILPYFPNNLTELCSPFFGGGSIEFALAQKGIKIYAYDAFYPLVCFWNSMKNERDKLADEVQAYFPLSKVKFYAMQEEMRNETQLKLLSSLQIAARFYVLNRSSFSGSTISGGISPNTPRFNQQSIDRIKIFSMENVEIKEETFEKSIPLHSDRFLYCDPPYLLRNSNLYGNNGDKHKQFSHDRLCSLLKMRNNWILSYNDCEQIRSMYKDYEILVPEWKYGMSKDKKSKEILIVNY